MVARIKVTQLFFDKPKVKRAVDKAQRRNFQKAGGYIRKTAQRSMRKRIKPSLPGQPPHAHVGTLRRLLFYSWDMKTKTVVVGPYALPGRGHAPRALEYGGTSMNITSAKKRRAMQATRKQLQLLRHYDLPTNVNKFEAARMIDQLAANNWRQSTKVRVRKRDEVTRGGIGKDGKMKRTKRVFVRARPYMRPALSKNLTHVAKVWRNSVRAI